MRSIPIVLTALAAVGCQNTNKSKLDNTSTSTTSPGSAAVSTPVPTTTQATPGSAAQPQQPDQPEAPPRPPPPPLPDPLPGKRTDLTTALGSAWRSVIADLDGDGKRELVVVDSKTLRVLDATGREVSQSPVGGGIQVLTTADLDGDKRWEVYAGWGQTRDHMDAKARATAHRFEKGKLVEDVVLAPETSRQEVVALVPMPDTKQLLVGWFDSKYMVTTTIATKGATGWTGEKLSQLRTATSYSRGDVDGDGKPEVVVGRVYGDDKGIDGDAFVLGTDGSRKVIPSTRGLRSILVADSNGDKVPEIFMGDGWHQNYGQNARGFLTMATHDKGSFKTELVEDTAGQFEIMRMLPATINGKFAIVTLGSHYVRVFTRDGDKWTGQTIAGASRDIAVGDLDGKPGDEILVVGDKSELVKL